MSGIDERLLHDSPKACLATHRSNAAGRPIELVWINPTAADLARALRDGPTVVSRADGRAVLVVRADRRAARVQGPDGSCSSVPVAAVVETATPMAGRLAAMPGGDTAVARRLLSLEPLGGVFRLAEPVGAASARRLGTRIGVGLAMLTLFEVVAGVLFLLTWEKGVGWLADTGPGARACLVPLVGAAVAQLAAAATSRAVQVSTDERFRTVAAVRVLDAPAGGTPPGAGRLLAAASEAGRAGAELGPLVAVSLTAATNLAIGGVVLGAVAPAVAASIAVGVAVSVALGRRFSRIRRDEGAARRSLGRRHYDALRAARTLRLAAPGTFDALDDHARRAYPDTAHRADRMRVALTALLPRLWLVVAIATLTATVEPTHAPAGLGATLLAYYGFRSLGLAHVAIGEIRSALAATRTALPPAVTADGPRPNADGGDQTPKLDGTFLRGRNTSGRSTCGRAIAASDPAAMFAPAGEEDHVFTATILDNVLLGRGAPYSPEQRTEATELLHDLQLGSLIEKAPFGVDTLVGETGWRLSEGERARVLLARALLARPRLLVVDELLEPLDPTTRDHVLAVSRRRTERLIVITPE